MAKKKTDKNKIMVRIVAGIMAGLMILSISATCIIYLINA